MTTTSTLKIDQSKLFAACDHDCRTMAIMLTVAELASGERVEVKFAHAFLDRDVAYYRDELLKALGAD